MNPQNELSQAMFLPSSPCNPIPFANGLVEGCKQNGIDWIQSDEAKMILFTILQQAYGTAFLLDSFKEFQKFYALYYKKEENGRKENELKRMG